MNRFQVLVQMYVNMYQSHTDNLSFDEQILLLRALDEARDAHVATMKRNNVDFAALVPDFVTSFIFGRELPKEYVNQSGHGEMYYPSGNMV